MPGFNDEISEQPAALRRTLDGLKDQLARLDVWRERLANGSLRRVIFSGMGASHAANLPAQLHLLQQGVEAFVIESSELLHYQLPLATPDTLLVLISQSGRSVETVRLLDALDGRVPVAAITNNQDSPLAHHAETTLLIDAGQELTVASKTYTCTLAALHLLATALGGGDAEAARQSLYAAADALEGALPSFRALAPQWVDYVTGAQTISYLGRGTSLASALGGALCTKESSKYPTEGMQAAQFRHGPIEMADARIAAVVFVGDAKARPLNLALAEELSGYGARVVLVGTGVNAPWAFNVPLPEVPERMLPLLEIVPVQCFAAQFAAQQGYTPGDFRYIQKVTTKE